MLLCWYLFLREFAELLLLLLCTKIDLHTKHHCFTAKKGIYGKRIDCGKYAISILIGANEPSHLGRVANSTFKIAQSQFCMPKMNFFIMKNRESWKHCILKITGRFGIFT